MSTTELHEAFEALARLADHDPVPDRMAGITKKRRAQRTRTVTIGAAAAVLAVGLGSTALAQSSPDGRSGPPIATSSPDPTPDASSEPSPAPRSLGLNLSKRIVPAGGDSYRVSYRVTGTAIAVRDRQTGGRVDLGGIWGTQITLDGKPVMGTDPGDVECIVGGPVETYDQLFGPFEVTIPPGEHTVAVSVRWCNAAGDLERTAIGDRTYYLGEAAVADRATADLDGDGTRERLVLVDEGAESALEVREGSVRGRVDLQVAEPTFVSGVRDLDGDGTKEVLVDAQDGTLTRTFVVTVGDGTPRLAVPAAGSPNLLDGVTDGRFWGALVIDGVLTSWTGVDEGLRPGTDEPLAQDVPLEGGTWRLDGTTLRFTSWSTAHCSGPGAGPVEC